MAPEHHTEPRMPRLLRPQSNLQLLSSRCLTIAEVPNPHLGLAAGPRFVAAAYRGSSQALAQAHHYAETQVVGRVEHGPDLE